LAVRGKPIINDATVDVAIAAGTDRVANIVSSGSDAPATTADVVSAWRYSLPLCEQHLSWI